MSAASDPHDGGLVEREQQAARISELLRGAATGNGRLLVVEGVAGIGKTAVVGLARELAARSGFEVLHATGGELERTDPLGVVRTLFTRRLAAATATERAELLSGAAAAAAGVLELSGEPIALTSTLSRALSSLYWLCANLAENRPLLLALDDVHWADPGSVGFLEYLARRLDDVPVLVLLATRPDEPEADYEATARLLAHPRAELMRLDPLSRAGAASLIGAVAPTSTASFRAACHELTRGNPFLLRELVAAARADGLPLDGEGVSHLSTLGPETITRSVLLRLSRLGDPAAAVARAVAVLGAGVELRHVAELARVSQADAGDGAEALQRAGLLAAGYPLEFEHPVIRSAIYRDLSVVRAARQHGAAARLLERDGAPVEQVARHLLPALPEGDPWVVGQLVRGASAARDGGALEAAVAYLRRALAEPPPEDERFELTHDLADIEMATGMHDVVNTAADAHRLATTVDARVRAARMLTLAALFAQQGETLDRAHAVLRATVAELQAVDPARAAQLTAFALVLRAADPGELDFLEAAGAGTDGQALAAIAWQRLLANDPAVAAIERAERALAAAAAVRGAGGHFGWWQTAIFALQWAGDLQRAQDEWRSEQATARRNGDEVHYLLATGALTLALVQAGALIEAEGEARLARQAAALLPAHNFWRLESLNVLVDVLLEREEWSEAGTLLGEADIEALPASWPADRLRLLRGRWRLGCGDAGGALEDLGTGSEPRLNPALWPWRSYAALAHAQLGEAELARQAAGEEVAHARTFGAPGPLGRALRVAGVVAGGERRAALVAESIQVLDGTPCRLELARSQFELGAGLRRAGERRAARDRLRIALDLAVACGATGLAARAREELDTSGARLSRERLSGLESLTPSELRVAKLAATGASNRDIAQSLFLSRKTVETHLGSVYRKLDVTRDRLTAVLAVTHEHP